MHYKIDPRLGERRGQFAAATAGLWGDPLSFRQLLENYMGFSALQEDCRSITCLSYRPNRAIYPIFIEGIRQFAAGLPQTQLLRIGPDLGTGHLVTLG